MEQKTAAWPPIYPGDCLAATLHLPNQRIITTEGDERNLDSAGEDELRQIGVVADAVITSVAAKMRGKSPS